MSEPDVRTSVGALSQVQLALGDEFAVLEESLKAEESIGSDTDLYRSILECWLVLARDYAEDGALDIHAHRMIARVERLLKREAPTQTDLRLGLFLAATLELPI